VLKLYGDRRETDAPHGRVALAILIFQDFLIVPMIVLTPVLGGDVAASAGELAARFGGSLAAVAAAFLAARYLMPGLFHQLVRARLREVLVLGALGICLAMATLTPSLGFSLALTCAEADTILADARVVALGQALDDLMDGSRATRRHHALVRELGVGQR